MQSPSTETGITAAYILGLNLLRALGEKDNDTISECGRNALDRLPPMGGWCGRSGGPASPHGCGGTSTRT